MSNKIGKIMKVTVGKGGYQEAMIGVSFMLGNDEWQTMDFWGTWSGKRNAATKWTEEGRIETLGEIFMKINLLLEQSKVERLSQLEGKPIEVVFDGDTLKSWRILTEAI